MRVLLIAFWVRSTWSFFSDDMLEFMQVMEPVLFLFFDVVIIFMGIALMSRKIDRIFAVVFVVVAYVSSCTMNGLSVSFFINGLRDFISWLFVIPIINWFLSDPDRKKMFVPIFDRNLYIFLIVQVPCILFQFFMHGAGDAVGGSMGYGYSGVMTTLIFAISFYLMNKRMDPDRYLASLWENKILILLLIPTQLNETKISFVYIILYFLLLLPINRTTFIRLFFAIPVLIVLLYVMMVSYVASTGGDPSQMFSLDYYAEAYLYDEDESIQIYVESLFDKGEEEGEMEDIPRFSKLMLLSDLSEENPGHSMCGFGLGHFKGGSVMDESELVLRYRWLFFGTIPYLFHVWVQLGWIGIAMMLLYLVNLFCTHRRGQKCGYNMHIFMILVFLMLLVYNDSIRLAVMCIPITYMILNSWRDADEEESEEPEDDEQSAVERSDVERVGS